MPSLRKAVAIRKGAVVGPAAPAPIDAELVDAGAQRLRELGLEPAMPPSP